MEAYLTGHDGIDFFVMHAFIESVKRKTATPMDVYDAAAWSAITPLSETSVELGNQTVDFPDFTGGRWMTHKNTFALTDEYWSNVWSKKLKTEKWVKIFRQQAIINCTIHTGNEIITDGVIVIENGIIKSVQKDLPENIKLVDLDGYNIAAGLIDIQLNGGDLSQFSQYPTEERIEDMYESSLKYSTTHLLPCLISSSHENIL